MKKGMFCAVVKIGISSNSISLLWFKALNLFMLLLSQDKKQGMYMFELFFLEQEFVICAFLKRDTGLKR